MISLREPLNPRVAGFRTKLLVAIMLVLSTVTLVALDFALTDDRKTRSHDERRMAPPTPLTWSDRQ